MRYISTIERQAIKRGLEQGIEQGERSLILRLLKRRFGELPDTIVEAIHKLSIEALENLGEALLDFEQMDDCLQWLSHHQTQSDHSEPSEPSEPSEQSE